MTSWRFEAHVDASPDAVFAWLSDYREDDHARPAFLAGSGIDPKGKRSVRKVLSRDADHIELHDTYGREEYPMSIDLVREARELRMRGQHGYRAVWRAEPDGAGTRVVVEARLEPTGIMRVLAPIFARAFRKQMAADFRGHVADMQDELSA